MISGRQLIANIPFLGNWIGATPTAPKLYWDVYSQEERWKKICIQLHKITQYLDEVITPNVNEVINLINELDALVRSYEERVSTLETEMVDTDNKLNEEINNRINAVAQLVVIIDMLDNKLDDEIIRATDIENNLNGMIQVLQGKTISGYTYNSTTNTLNIALTNGTNFQTVLPLVTTDDAGLFSAEDYAKFLALQRLNTYRGAFLNAASAPQSTPDSRFSGGEATDGDWCYLTNYDGNGTAGHFVINVSDSGVCTYTWILDIEGELGIATPTTPGLIAYDNATIKKNSQNEMYANVDGQTIYYDPISGTLKAKQYSGTAGSTAKSDGNISKIVSDTVTLSPTSIYPISGSVGVGTIVYDKTNECEGVITDTSTTTDTHETNTPIPGELVSEIVFGQTVLDSDNQIMEFANEFSDGVGGYANGIEYGFHGGSEMHVHFTLNGAIGRRIYSTSEGWLIPDINIGGLAITSITGFLSNQPTYTVTETIIDGLIVTTVQIAPAGFGFGLGDIMYSSVRVTAAQWTESHKLANPGSTKWILNNTDTLPRGIMRTSNVDTLMDYPNKTVGTINPLTSHTHTPSNTQTGANGRFPVDGDGSGGAYQNYKIDTVYQAGQSLTYSQYVGYTGNNTNHSNWQPNIARDEWEVIAI